MGREKYSLSKRIKGSIKGAVKLISDFEKTAVELAVENDYDYVVCGHIHQPAIKKVKTSKGSCTYLNSGDWVENLTALEYYNERWRLFHYHSKKYYMYPESETEITDDELPELISAMLNHL